MEIAGSSNSSNNINNSSNSDNSNLRNEFKKCIIYCRVSSMDQTGENHISLEAQQNVCKDFTNDNRLKPSQIITEVVSAARNVKKRHINNIVKNNKNTVIIIYDVSRFSRNVEHGTELLKHLHKNGNVVYFVNENIRSDSNNFIKHIQDAENESKAIGRRVSNAIREKRRLGFHIGIAPFGYKLKKVRGGNLLEEYEEEHKVVDFIQICKNTPINMRTLNQSLRLIVPNPIVVDETPIIGENENGDEINIMNDKLSNYEIAEFLNEYEVYKRGSKWTSSKINSIKIIDNLPGINEDNSSGTMIPVEENVFNNMFSGMNIENDNSNGNDNENGSNSQNIMLMMQQQQLMMQQQMQLMEMMNQYKK